MEKIIFNDRKINKSNFYLNEKPFFIHDLDFSKILISKKDSYGKNIKYFIGYNDDDAIRPLCLKLPQMVDYVKHFDTTKTRYFKIIEKRLLKGYIKIWKRNNDLIMHNQNIANIIKPRNN